MGIKHISVADTVLQLPFRDDFPNHNKLSLKHFSFQNKSLSRQHRKTRYDSFSLLLEDFDR